MSEPKNRPVILSGVQPTGQLHIGNYLGAIRNWVELQDTHDCFFPVVDLHALTVRQEPARLRQICYDFMALYIACGIDPERSCIFMQSHVPEHAELAWVLNCHTYFGELSRMTQFKEKSQKQASNINAGLFTYPVLMAADILLYRADLVPVGADQKQHLELARNLAERFNQSYGETLVVPSPFIPKVGGRVMKLQDPESKMSKTDDNPRNSLGILDTPQQIRSKIAKAVTDSGSSIQKDDSRPGISNLMGLMSALNGESFEEIEARYAGQGYGPFKQELGDLAVECLAPVKERYDELRRDKAKMAQILAEGAEKARRRARRTLAKVHRRIGLVDRARNS